ncbi:MAG: hypothetical protein L6R39_005022 [Caloplaca ligustica]|nr:MAG: hypothetical protein L6R39_005022 [Caloplaca ligustica]
MAPTIHLVRHAQAVHNLTTANQHMHDPPLTSFGEQQCRELSARFPHHSSIDLLVSSPLRRTMQTTLIAFKPELSRGVKYIALPEVQETSDLPCDTGSKLSVLKEEFKDQPVDFSLVPKDWDSKQGKWVANQEAIERRCCEARKWLKDRSEANIVVVTHGGLLHYLTEDWAGCKELQGTRWENCEFRSYRFEEGDNKNASLQETEESKSWRNETSKPLTKEEKTQLRETATKKRDEEGYEKATEV